MGATLGSLSATKKVEIHDIIHDAIDLAAISQYDTSYAGQPISRTKPDLLKFAVWNTDVTSGVMANEKATSRPSTPLLVEHQRGTKSLIFNDWFKIDSHPFIVVGVLDTEHRCYWKIPVKWIEAKLAIEQKLRTSKHKLDQENALRLLSQLEYANGRPAAAWSGIATPNLIFFGVLESPLVLVSHPSIGAFEFFNTAIDKRTAAMKSSGSNSYVIPLSSTDSVTDSVGYTVYHIQHIVSQSVSQSVSQISGNLVCLQKSWLFMLSITPIETASIACASASSLQSPRVRF